MLISNFLKDTFISRIKINEPVVELGELTIDRNKVKNLPSLAESARSKIVIQINRVLSVICLASFGYIILFSFIHPSDKIPEIIQNTFSLTLGYFGSALVSFLEKQSPKK